MKQKTEHWDMKNLDSKHFSDYISTQYQFLVDVVNNIDTVLFLRQDKFSSR